MRLLPLALLMLLASVVRGEEKPAPQAVKDLPATVRVTRELDAATLTPSDRQFVVSCHIHGEKLAFPLPEITLRDGERVTLSDTSTTQRVIAYKLENGVRTPIIREVTEGTIARFTVIGVDDTQVVVDALVTFSGVVRGATPEQQEKLNGSEGRRILDVVTLGDAITCPFGDKGRIEIMVQAK